MNVTRIPHLDGDPGVAQTIGQMRRLVTQGKQDPDIRSLAARILTAARVRPYDWMGEARAIFDWICKNIRFTRDVYGNETLHGAADIVRLGIGDCDDCTVLACALLQTIGMPCRIVTVATHSDGEFSHVYPEAEIDGRWIPVDCARQSPALGKSPAHCTRKRVWDLDSGGFTDMSGIRTSIAPGQGPQGAWRPDVLPQFRLAARRMTGTYLNAWPVAPPHQQFRRPPIGHGNYGRLAGRRALGDFDTGDLTDIITAATQGTANIISAERASPYNLMPTTSSGARSTPSLLPSFAPSSSIGGISTNTLLIGGGLLALAFVASRH